MKASLLASEWYEGGLEARSERRRLEAEADERVRCERGRGEGELEAPRRSEVLELRLEEREVRDRDEAAMVGKIVR